MMNFSQRIHLALLCLPLTGCGLPDTGFPLYSRPEGPYPRNKVALLTGDVAKVNGQPVPGGERAFELLPGCYEVSTPSSFARGDGYGAIMVDAEEFTTSFRMRAGYSYVVRLDARLRSSATGIVNLTVKEYLPSGKPSPEFEKHGRVRSRSGDGVETPPARKARSGAWRISS